MSLAVCNPDAFYPFRSLIQGPLRDPADLPKIERFIRSIVLHDDVKMLMEPWPDMDQDHAWTREEIAVGKRAVIVAIGPVIDEYERHNLSEYQNLLQAATRDDIDISNDLRQLAQDRAMTDSGPYFETHLAARSANGLFRRGAQWVMGRLRERAARSKRLEGVGIRFPILW